MPRPVLNLLRVKHEEIQIERTITSEAWHDHNLVFPNSNGGYINQSNFRRRYKKALADAGLREIRIHDIRHTFATVLIEEDVNQLIPVSRTLGHASTAITADLYAGTAKVSDQATSAMARNLFESHELSEMQSGVPLRPSQSLLFQEWPAVDKDIERVLIATADARSHTNVGYPPFKPR